jgi:hypothetical protein
VTFPSFALPKSSMTSQLSTPHITAQMATTRIYSNLCRLLSQRGSLRFEKYSVIAPWHSSSSKHLFGVCTSRGQIGYPEDASGREKISTFWMLRELRVPFFLD